MILWFLTALALEVTEAAVDEPGDVLARRQRLVVTFDDGPVDLLWSPPGTGQYKPLATNVTSPYTTRPLPRGSWVRGPDGEARAPGVWTPADVAAWSGPGLRGADVVDLSEPAAETVWAGTLGGGLARWDGESWTHWTRRDGLPGDLAIALQVTPDGTWVATDQGVARVTDSVEERIVSGLPDPYTQAIRTDGDDLWAGTWKGLSRIRNGVPTTVLEPWSCFALVPGPDRRVWVGYEGLRGLPEGEPIEGVDPEARIYDTDPLPTGIWLATRDDGLVWLEEGQTETIWRPPHGGIYAIARSGQDLLLAAEEDGLWHLSGRDRLHYGRAEGLPGDVVNEVVPAPEQLVWVGTNRGVALLNPHSHGVPLPLAPLPAGVAVRDVLPTRRGIWVASEDALLHVGQRAPRGADTLQAAVGPDARHLVHTAEATWVVEDSAALRLSKGTLTRIPLPAAEPVAAFSQGEQLTVAFSDGWAVWVPGASGFSPVQPIDDLVTMDVDTLGGLWWIAGGKVFRNGAGGTTAWSSIPEPRDLSMSPVGAFVASAGGLYRLDADIHEVSAGWKAGPLVAVAATDTAVWAAGEDGRLWGPDPSRPQAIDLGAYMDGVEIVRLIPDDHGVWVATSDGAFRVVR